MKYFSLSGKGLIFAFEKLNLKEMPRKFLNVKKIIEESGLKKCKVAEALFPDVKFPQRAFSRILVGEAELSASQISVLADLVGCEVGDLYEPDRWLWDQDRENKLVFRYGTSFTAIVDKKTWETTLYHKDELIIRDKFCDESTPIGEFLREAQNAIQEWLDIS